MHVSCPYCLAPGYQCHKNGRNPNSSQRYHCRLCQRHFSPEAQSKKQQQQELARTFMASPNASARATAKRLGVHHRTVLRWLDTGQPPQSV